MAMPMVTILLYLSRQSMIMALCVLILLLLLSIPVPGRAALSLPKSAKPSPAEQQNIVVLDSWPHGNPIPESIDRGIVAALQEGGYTLGNVFIEHLDFTRAPTSEHRTNTVNMLRHKLAGKSIGVVIAIGASATDFMVREGTSLFPGVAVLTLISPNYQVLSPAYGQVLNIPWQVDPAGTLRAALDLFPQTRRVFVVTGAQDRILPFLDQARKAFAPWQGRLEIEYSNEMAYDEMLRRIATLPQDTIVIYSPFFTDSTGRAFIPAEVVVKVCQTATVPVFATLEEYLGSGIVGGSLLRTEDVGRQAGRIVLDYLQGRIQPVEPVTTFDTAPLLEFDWRALQRWKVNISRLPEKSIFINRPPTLWGQYKGTVISTAAALVIMTFFIIVLLILNRRLERAKNAASDSEARFRVMIEHAPEAIIAYDIDLRRIVDANTKAEQLFGCNRETLLQVGPERFYPAHQPNGIDIFDSVNNCIERVMMGEEIVFERTLQSLDGRDLTCEVRLVRLPYREQRLLRASFIDITERKQSVAALRESEERYRSLVEDQIELVSRFKPDGTFLYVNSGFCRYFGKSKEKVIGSKWHPVPHPNDLPMVGEQLSRLSPEHPVVTIENRIYDAKGEIRWVEFSNKALFNEDGTIQQIQSVGRDITDRKRAEEALRTLTTKLSDVLESTGDGVIAMDHDLVVTYFNVTAEGILGRRREDVVGKYLFDAFPEARGSIFDERYHQAVRNREAMSFEVDFEVPPYQNWYQVRVFPSVDGISVFFQIITEQKKLEVALRESQARLRALSDNLPGGAVYQIDSGIDGQKRRFTYFSAGVERIHEITSTAVLQDAQLLYGQIIEADRPFFAAQETQALTTMTPFRAEARFCLPSGAIRWCLFNAAPRRASNGHIIWDGVEIDITERKRAEKAIQTSLAEKEVLLREIYHRTKNNLQVVCSLLNLQSARFSDPQLLQAFQDTGNRIRSMSLVHEKLYQSKDLSHIDLKDYIQDLANSLLVNYQMEPAKISLQFDLQSVIVNIDTTMPCGLMLNEVISNAIKYAFPEGRKGTISIFLSSSEDGGIELKVADDGVGLPSELDIWNTDSLGLKLINNLAKNQLQGKLEVRREQGTEFRLIFRELDYKPRI